MCGMKNTIIAIIAIIIIGLAVILSLKKGAPAKEMAPAAYQPASATQAQVMPEPADKTSDIQNDLNKIDTGNLDVEFKDIDNSLKGL